MAPAVRHTLKRGVFIVIDGIDGAGKSTQLQLLENKYKEDSFPVTRTREPTSGTWGQKIRGIAQYGRDNISREEELEWFLKDRKEHVSNVIAPALRNKGIVISDRYYHSTIAYQGALGIDPETIKKMNEERFPRPDLVILLDVSPQKGIERIVEGRKEKNNQGFEQEGYLKEVRRIFKQLRHDPGVYEIDGTRPVEIVFNEILSLTDEAIKRSSG